MNTPSLSGFGPSLLVADTVTPQACRLTEPVPAPLKSDGAKVAMRLFGRPDQDLLSFGRTHFTAMEDNPYFLNPSPSQETFGAMLDAFADDCAEVMALKTALAVAVTRKNTRREALIQQLDRRGSYVQSLSNGNKVAITSSALGVQRESHPVGELPPPSGVRVLPGVSAGEIILSWDKVKHALFYMLEYGPEGETPVQIVLTGLRKKTLILPRLGVTYVFRIATSGTAGLSNWSPPVRRIAA